MGAAFRVGAKNAEWALTEMDISLRARLARKHGG